MNRHQVIDDLPDRSILIDGRPLQSASSVRGIGTYLRGLLTGFHELGVGRAVELLLRVGPIPNDAGRLSIAVARHRIPVLHPTLQPTADLALIARALREETPRLFHGAEWGQPLLSRVPIVITVHDLVPFVFPAHYPWVRRARILPLAALRAAQRVIAVSHATARDLARIAHLNPERITVVHEGVSPAFRPSTPEQVTLMRDRLGLGDRRFVLAVGTFEPRKRIRLLAAVIRTVRRSADVDLVIVGDQGKFAAPARSALAAAGVAENAHLLGHVSLADLTALYTTSECLLFTSAYEGFGLPPLEAMACGTPVVMFDNSSLPEIAGPSMLVADGDAPAMADAACRLIDAREGRADLIAAGQTWASTFTWRKSAEQTLGVYARALARSR